MLKDPVIHKVNNIYNGIFSCSEFYVAETKRNSEVRWREDCSAKKKSEVGEHLFLNPGHTVTREILTNAHKQVNNWKILEAFYIRTLQSTLNNQLNTECKVLFKNGITQPAFACSKLTIDLELDFSWVINIYKQNILKSFLTWWCRYTKKSCVIYQDKYFIVLYLCKKWIKVVTPKAYAVMVVVSPCVAPSLDLISLFCKIKSCCGTM